MRLQIIIIIFLVFSFSLIGQKHSLNDIQNEANKYINSLLSDSSLFSLCKIDEEIGIRYTNIKKDTLFKWVKESKEIKLYKKKGVIVSYTICYFLKFSYPKCPVLDSIKGRFYIELDKSLSLIKKPNLSFIPKSFMKNDSCDFLSKEKAFEITNSQNFKLGTDSLKMNLDFDDKRQIYTWNISQISCKTIDEIGRCWGDIEILILEAETGKVISHHITSYGWIVDF